LQDTNFFDSPIYDEYNDPYFKDDDNLHEQLAMFSFVEFFDQQFHGNCKKSDLIFDSYDSELDSSFIEKISISTCVDACSIKPVYEYCEP
jgi:hypothetical protein